MTIMTGIEIAGEADPESKLPHLIFQDFLLIKIASRYSRNRRSSRSPIDKKKLLEIARKNAISMLKNGALPASMTDAAKEKLMAKIKHGGE